MTTSQERPRPKTKATPRKTTARKATARKPAPKKPATRKPTARKAAAPKVPASLPPVEQHHEQKVPNEIKRWNWGAFFFSWIWGIAHGVWIGLLALITFVWFLVAI